MRLPVWPICSWCGRQPRLVTTRETPSAPPSSSASSATSSKPSRRPGAAPGADDDPRRGERARPVQLRDGLARHHPRHQVRLGDLRRELAQRRAHRDAAAASATAWPATVSTAGRSGSTISSSTAPPTTWRVTRSGRPGRRSPRDPDDVRGHRHVQARGQVGQRPPCRAGCRARGRRRRRTAGHRAPARPPPTPHRRRPRRRRRWRGAPRRRRRRRAGRPPRPGSVADDHARAPARPSARRGRART